MLRHETILAIFKTAFRDPSSAKGTRTALSVELYWTLTDVLTPSHYSNCSIALLLYCSTAQLPNHSTTQLPNYPTTQPIPVSKDALALSESLFTLFITEALARASNAARHEFGLADSAPVNVDVKHLELILPQLLLDF